ncbi:MAG: HAD-IIB family hydrolase, partial [Elusimicrobia bacterium]|nr:HAD-IIB family hydrolase [Elusimicrobiota bacterium]
MRYRVFVCDYDGTLASEGRVSEESLAALERLRESGRKAVLVTGRELEDLLGVFPKVDLFDRVIAENGALLHRPGTGVSRLLTESPSAEFVTALRARRVEPLSVGRAIVSTREAHEKDMREVIRALGLDLRLILNKGAVMALPAGVDKATGLAEALRELGLSSRQAVGVGDGENDEAFLRVCG